MRISKIHPKMTARWSETNCQSQIDFAKLPITTFGFFKISR
jgi:hypothetical protein